MFYVKSGNSEGDGARQAYSPVAVTPQVSVNTRLELAGNDGMARPAWNAARLIGAAGHTAAPLVTAQVTAVQARPGATGSVTMAPAASDGPVLLTVML